MAIPILQFERIRPFSQSVLDAQRINYNEAQQRTLEQQILQEREKRRREAEIRELRRAASQDPRALNALAAIDPASAKKIQDFQVNQGLQRGQAAQALLLTPLANRPKVYERLLEGLQAAGEDISEYPAEYDPKIVDPIAQFAVNQARDLEKQFQRETEAPAAVREFEYYQDLSPEEQQQYLNVKRNVLQTGLTLTPQGEVTTLPGAPQAKASIKAAEERGEKLGALDVERRKNLTKANTALKTLESKSKLVTNTIDKALKTILPGATEEQLKDPEMLRTLEPSGFATGYGSYLAVLPKTQARRLENYLTTIRSNVGFDNLQEMRDNSPTGGALGQVSEFENILLQAIEGALDPKSPEQLVDNLLTIRESYPRVLEERKDAFNFDYGQYVPENKRPKKDTTSTKTIRRYNPTTRRLE